jgi:hypothetical protein
VEQYGRLFDSKKKKSQGNRTDYILMRKRDEAQQEIRKEVTGQLQSKEKQEGNREGSETVNNSNTRFWGGEEGQPPQSKTGGGPGHTLADLAAG